MNVLYFDNHIVVVNKPAGIVTESYQEKSLEEEVRQWVCEKFSKKGKAFLFAAHRLDKLVSGIVVFAKTSKALQRLHELFRSRQMQKTYFALVEGSMPLLSGCLEDYLVRKEFCSQISSKEDNQAKKAVLSYVVKKDFGGRSLLEVDLHTGRYHQIRVQLAHSGHPVVNDVKYGARSVGNVEAIALHHQTLQIIHPVSKEKLVFSADLPDYWKMWM